MESFGNDFLKAFDESYSKIHLELQKQIEEEFKRRIRNIAPAAYCRGEKELANLAFSLRLDKADLDSEEGIRKVRDAFLEKGYEISLQQEEPEFEFENGILKTCIARTGLKLIVKKVMEF